MGKIQEEEALLYGEMYGVGAGGGGVKAVIEKAQSQTIVHGYSVPDLNADQIVNLYNSFIDGAFCLVGDATDTATFAVTQADTDGDNVFVKIQYFDNMIVTYETTSSGTNITGRLIPEAGTLCNLVLNLVDDGGDQITGATVKIHNKTNKTQYGEYEYDGEPLHISLPAEFIYNIECGYVSGYAEPLNYVFKAPLGEKSVTRTYNAGGRVYAFHIDGDEDNPNNNIEYLQDAVDATPAKMNFDSGEFDYGSWEDAFFMPKPCMLRSSGVVDCYLDPNDYSKKEDGTASPVNDVNFDGNAMMEWGQGGKRIWYKIVPDDASTSSATIYVADHKHDDDYKAWSFLDNNGDLMDHFYTPIYCGGYDSNNKMRSISGLACGNNKNGSYELTAAQANNTTDAKEWNTEVLCDHQLIQILLMLMGKSTDMQETFGYGNYTGGSSASNLLAAGTADNKGLFYGEGSASNKAVKVFGMENYWGNQWRRYLGHVTNGSGVQLYKLTWSLLDGSSATGYNNSGNGYINSGIAKPAGGYISKEEYSNGRMLASVTSGTSSTYYCDYYYTGNSCYALHGGACSSGLSCGAFTTGLDGAFSGALWSAGAALSCKPIVNTNKKTKTKKKSRKKK